MQFGRSLLAAVILTAAIGAAEPAWSLPENPQAIVIELCYGADVRNAPEPALQLRRDGTFTGDAGTDRQISGRLSDGEIRELLNEIIESAGALRLTSRGLNDQIRDASLRTGRPAQVRAGTEMLVRITLADRVHEFQCVSPEVLRTRYPDLPDLDRVCRIRRRLENVVAVARAGGKPAAERLATLATEELRRHNGTSARVTARDLQSVRGQAGDLRQVQFVVQDDRSGGSAGRHVQISIFESPGAPPRVSITTSAAPL